MLLHCAAALSRLPLRVHYALADYFVYPLMYYVVRYRRKIVAMNLRNSFPDLTETERKQIERDFYHQFCDTIVEIVYGYSMPEAEMKQRVVFENAEETSRLIKAAGGGVFMLAHLGNWEWYASVQQWLDPAIMEMNVYRRLKNPAMDRLMLAIRAKRGGVCVEKQRILREIISYRAQHKIASIALICDQKPRPEVTRTWVPFLHQETGFLDGGEIIGKKFNYPVFYAHLERIKRGYYKARVEVLTTDPQNTADGEITTAYARALEQNILEQPHLWLWTHNRFKWCKV